MDIKTIKARLQSIFETHGYVMGSILMGVLVGTALSTAQGTTYTSYLLREEVSMRYASDVSPADAARSRRLERAMRRTDAVAQVPLDVFMPLRPAAPQVHETASDVDVPQPSDRDTIHAETIPADAAASSAPEAPHEATAAFPAFGKAVFPVSRVPDWGAMTTPAQWDRRYGDIRDDEYVRVPAYDLKILTLPMKSLLTDRNAEETIRILTAKLTYSTRFFGAYDLDASEYTAPHPGIDIKLPAGTPVGSIAGGKVHTVDTDDILGLHVIVEHRAGDAIYYSIYGHLASAAVRTGQDVSPGTPVGTVGMTGNTSAPHLHLQVDRGTPGEALHSPYRPLHVPVPAQAAEHTIHPITFIRKQPSL